jgi:hypothetical protein
MVVLMNEKDKANNKSREESLIEFLKNSSLDEILPFLNRPDDLPRDIDFSDLFVSEEDGQKGQNRER